MRRERAAAGSERGALLVCAPVPRPCVGGLRGGGMHCSHCWTSLHTCGLDCFFPSAKRIH